MSAKLFSLCFFSSTHQLGDDDAERNEKGFSLLREREQRGNFVLKLKHRIGNELQVLYKLVFFFRLDCVSSRERSKREKIVGVGEESLKLNFIQN